MDTPKPIQLRVVNQSQETNNPSVLIFQKNIAPGAHSSTDPAMAWIVIQNLGHGSYHPFEYEFMLHVDANDSFGNYTPQMTAPKGSAFALVQMPSGDVLRQKPVSHFPDGVSVENALPEGAAGASVYRSGKLLASKANMAPGQEALFQFQPVIWIGVVSEVQEGQPVNPAIGSDINTQINLTGIASADIVWKGGGTGPNAESYSFSLENIVYAS